MSHKEKSKAIEKSVWKWYLSPLNFLPIIYILFINNSNYSRYRSFLKKEEEKREK